MILLLASTSSGCLARSVFVVCSYDIYFFVTMIPCELALRLLPNPWRFLPYAPIRAAMYILLAVYWVRRGREVFERATARIEKNRWLPLCVFSVVSLLCVTLVMSRLLMLNSDEGFWEYAISLCMLIVVLGAYVLIIRLMAILNNENETRMIREREKLLLSELNAQKAFVEQARQNRHDLRHHTAMLRDFLAHNDTKALADYLGKYESALGEQGLDSWCENTVVNALLRSLSSRCAQSGITLDCAARIPEQLPLSPTDVCVLFGNLLENAFEASQAHGGGTILIRAKTRENRLFLSVQNPVAGTVRFKDGIPLTTKRDGGIGTRSILSALQKCGGMVDFSQEGRNFMARVILPL